MARRFPEGVKLEDLCADTGAPFNQTKLEILAQSHIFAAAQGAALA